METKSRFFVLVISMLISLALLGQVQPSSAVTPQILGGDGHAVALSANGTLWVWGLNDQGELGDGTVTDRYAPVQIGPEHQWVSIAVGSRHTVALKKDGTLWAWGQNYSGQVGDSTTVVVPNEFNILIDPRHQEIYTVTISRIERYTFDSRLLRTRKSLERDK